MLILVAMLCLQFFFSFFVCRRRFLSWIRIRLAHKGDFVCPYYCVVVLLSFFVNNIRYLCLQHAETANPAPCEHICGKRARRRRRGKRRCHRCTSSVFVRGNLHFCKWCHKHHGMYTCMCSRCKCENRECPLPFLSGVLFLFLGWFSRALAHIKGALHAGWSLLRGWIGRMGQFRYVRVQKTCVT